MHVLPPGVLVEGSQSPADGEEGEGSGDDVQVRDGLWSVLATDQRHLDQEHGSRLAKGVHHAQHHQVTHLMLHGQHVDRDAETDVSPQDPQLQHVHQQDGHIAGSCPVDQSPVSNLGSK